MGETGQLSICSRAGLPSWATCTGRMNWKLMKFSKDMCKVLSLGKNFSGTDTANFLKSGSLGETLGVLLGSKYHMGREPVLGTKRANDILDVWTEAREVPITPHSALVRYHIHFRGPQCKTEIDKLDSTLWGQQDGGWSTWENRLGELSLSRLQQTWFHGTWGDTSGVSTAVESERAREKMKSASLWIRKQGNLWNLLATRSYSDKKKLFKAIKHLQTVKILIDTSANMRIRNLIFLF